MKKSKLLIALLVLTSLFFIFTGCGEKEETTALSCSITVTAADILENRERMDENTLAFVPDNGIIFSETVSFSQGDDLFAVVTRALKDKKLQFDSQGGSYFTAFGNIYATESGGWLYRVNGVEPEVGANKYVLSDGDAAEFFYICDYNAYFAEIYG